MNPSTTRCPEGEDSPAVPALSGNRAPVGALGDARGASGRDTWRLEPVESEHSWQSKAESEPRDLLRPLPEGSRLQVLQADADQLVVFIPPGGNACNPLGWQALLFFAFLLFFTVGLGGSWHAANPKSVLWLGYPLVWLGWMGWYQQFREVLELKFARTILTVNQQRVILKKILFGHSRQRELSLAKGTECRLCQDFAIHEVLVHSVRVQHETTGLDIGTNLAQDDKEWLEAEIQDRLKSMGFAADSVTTPAVVAPPESASPGFGPAPEPLARDGQSEEVPPLLPSQLPPGSPIRLLEETPERLSFWFPVKPNPFKRVLVTLCFLLIGLPWGAAACGFGRPNLGAAGPFGPLDRADTIVFLTFAIILIGWAMYIAFGRTTICLTQDEFLCRWSLGRLGRQRVLPVSKLKVIYLRRDFPGAGDPLGAMFPSIPNMGGIIVATRCPIVIVALTAESSFSRQVAGLLRHQLETWGHPVPVRWVDPDNWDSP